MTAILRNNAAFRRTVDGPIMGGGGDGRQVSGLRRRKKVVAKWRHSEDPAAELMPAAEFLGQEPDFSAILEDFQDSPFNPAKRRVLGRLMGMFAMDYQGARAEERRFLRRLLRARNAREGYVANRALHLCGAINAIRRTLALGVAEARFAQGKVRGFLGAVQARVACTTFLLLGATGRENIWNLLVVAGGDDEAVRRGADPIIERALILKALGARRHRLGPWSRDGWKALGEVEEFAAAIRGCGRRGLAAYTTLYPGDPKRLPAVIEGLGASQRAALIGRGEVDPIFAWEQHGGRCELGELDVDQDHESIMLPDLDRSPLLERPRLHQALAEGRTIAKDCLTSPQLEALSDYLVGHEMGETRMEHKDEALRVLSARGFDVIHPDSVEAIRRDARGVYKFDAARGMGLLLSRYTGAVYVRRVFSDQVNAVADPIRQIVLSIESGLAVPFTVQELRKNNLKAWTILVRHGGTEEIALELRHPASGATVILSGKQLLQPTLPGIFGQRARADAYLAPAALDLLAPPFGIVCAQLGIRDVL
ncbi:MAG: hypothetical protein R3C68_19670 [Myxococcota bacterium]